MTSIFDGEMFGTYFDVITTGIAAGFTLGFMSWGFGFAVHGIIKLFKSI